MFSIVLFLLSALYSAKANPGELTFAIQRYHALAGRTMLVVASGPQAYELAKKCKKIDPFLDFYVHPIAEYADIEREIKKARTTYGAQCALYLSIQNRKWSLTPHGTCHDPSRTLSIQEKGEKWTLIDNKKREVRAIDYAVLTQDDDLLQVLKTEEKKTYDLGQHILLGSSIVAGGAIIPLLFGKSEEVAQLEDRRWSAVFLLASSAILYEASKIPPRMKQGKNISNYRPKSMVVERLESIWPTTPPSEETESTEDPAENTEQMPSENTSEDVSDTAQETSTTEEQATEPTPPQEKKTSEKTEEAASEESTSPPPPQNGEQP